MKVTKFLLTLTAILFGAFHLAAQQPAQQQEDARNGKIGPYAIQMFITLSDATEGDIVGYYIYTDRPATQFKLKLQHMEAINAEGSMNVVLNEYSPRGKHTGTFNGQYECRGSLYEGTFTNSKGKRLKFQVE